MTAHDWFASLFTSGQWLAIFIVLGIILAIWFPMIGASEGASGEDLGGLFILGAIAPLLVWLLVMGILHFVSFLVSLWTSDWVIGMT